MTLKNPKKVEITISDCDFNGERHTFCESVQDEQDSEHFTSVNFSDSTYGGASHCTNKERIKSAIESAKKTILREGDIPVIKDLRKKRELSDWF